MRVSEPKNKASYGEAHGGSFKFMLVNSEGVGYHSPCSCKDFFTDIGYCEEMDQSANVYGFNWRRGMTDLYAKKQYMALVHPNFNEDTALRLECFLNDIEDRQGIPSSTVVMDGKRKDVMIVTFHPKWWRRPYLISLFTQLCRIGNNYTRHGGTVASVNAHLDLIMRKGNPFCQYDNQAYEGPGNRMERVKSRMQTVLAGKGWSQEYSSYPTASASHFGGGFVSFDTAAFTVISA